MNGLREQQNPASRTHRIHRSPDQTITTDRQDGCICATSFGLLTHRFHHIGTRCINAVPQAVTCRYCKPLGIQIGSDYRGPSPFGQYTQYDTDGTLTYHYNRLSGCNPNLSIPFMQVLMGSTKHACS